MACQGLDCLICFRDNEKININSQLIEFTKNSSGEKVVQDLNWSATLSVQVDEIDEDHRRLVELFNILSHAVVDGDSRNYIEAVLDELISCIPLN